MCENSAWMMSNMLLNSSKELAKSQTKKLNHRR